MITQRQLKEALKYDPETGLFYWLQSRRRNVRRAGDIAGLPRKKGYSQIWIDNKPYSSHRLAFLYMTGEWPKVVDHVDGDITNNRWNNLRECHGSTLNNANMKRPSRNTSGVKGVSWSSASGKWYASIMRHGKSFNLGYYESKDHAAAAYREAASRLFNEFARAA